MRPFAKMLGVVIVLWASAARASADCRAAALFAEQAEGLPAGLLLAIGKIETGRPDVETGAIAPWPWSTNLAGEGHYFATEPDAIAWTAQALAAGLTSIDVGCFQVNLLYHPNAFTSLEDAFDPAANALYAARFLASLYRRTGSWPLAVAQYHSANPALGGPYGAHVYAAWNGAWLGSFGTATAPAPARIPEFNSTMRPPVPTEGDPVVIRLAPRARMLPVILPDWATADGGEPGRPAGPRAHMAGPAMRLATGGRLPVVYRPNGPQDRGDGSQQAPSSIRSLKTRLSIRD